MSERHWQLFIEEVLEGENKQEKEKKAKDNP